MAKLILDIEPGVIKQAEHYANETHTDLSLLVQEFLKGFGNKKSEPIVENKIEIADWVKQLTLSKTPMPDFDHKAEYHKYLDEKYGL